MSADARSHDEPEFGVVAREAPYDGALGKTRLETVHFTLVTGEVVCVRVHTVVNAISDPALAERLLSGNLNWIQPADSTLLQQVTVPVVYHDEQRRLFVLVLPEGYRGRELEERAALLQRLAEDSAHPVPRYVVGFKVVFGETQLSELLDRGASSSDDSDLSEREEAIVSREAKLAEWEERLSDQKRRLRLELEQQRLLGTEGQEALTAEFRQQALELERRENELRRVEELLAERQAELERREERLAHQPVPLSGPDSPTKRADRKKIEAAARESAELDDSEGPELTLEPAVRGGAPDADAAREEAEEEGGLEVDERAADQDGAPAAKRKRSAKTAGKKGRRSRSKRRKDRDVKATPLAEAVLAVAEDDEERADVAAAEPGAEAASATVDETLAAPPSALPAELTHWREEKAPRPAGYLRDDQLHLAACLPPEAAEAFVGVDPVGVLQLHQLSSYPVVALGVYPAGRVVEEQSNSAVFWLLDVRNAHDQELIEKLSVDFRFFLEIYDELLEPVTSQEVHFPLEENVKIVRERGQEALSALSEADLDWGAAQQAFQAPDYPRLPGDPAPFAPNAFQRMDVAADIARAVSQVSEWSRPERQDDLILYRSFPASAWRALRARVIRSAIEFGIWMDIDLRRMALEEGFATSRRDLLRACLSGFERVSAGEVQSDLSPAREADNWRALLEEAEQLGLPVEPRWEELAEGARARAESGEEAGEDVVDAEDLIVEDEEVASAEADPDAYHGEAPTPGEGGLGAGADVSQLDASELVALLEDEAVRLDAALELCHRREETAIPELFAALEQMPKAEIVRVFPHLVGLGDEAAPYFTECLRSGSSLVRQGSALAVGALQSELALEGLIDLLLDEPTDIWSSVAVAIGDLGGDAIMDLASRVRQSKPEQLERLSVAMAEVARQAGTRDVLEDLSNSQEETGAQVALRALEILAEHRVEDDVSEGLPTRDKSVLFFSARFFEAIADSERELGEDDILAEEDIIDEHDVVEEEPIP